VFPRQGRKLHRKPVNDVAKRPQLFVHSHRESVGLPAQSVKT
jgi:hypothetical protein